MATPRAGGTEELLALLIDILTPPVGNLEGLAGATISTTGGIPSTTQVAPGYVRVEDGATQQLAKVLAASTAPALTDPALVVTLSPNSSPAADGFGNSIAAVPQGINALQVVKGSPGFLGKVSITTAGTSSINIWNNASAASGVALWTSPATTPLGTVYDIRMPATLGITVDAQTGTTPAMTISFS